MLNSLLKSYATPLPVIHSRFAGAGNKKVCASVVLQTDHSVAM